MLLLRSRQPKYMCASIRQHASAYVSIRQHTSAYVSIRQHTSHIYYGRERQNIYVFRRYVYVPMYVSAGTSIYVGIYMSKGTTIYVFRRYVYVPIYVSAGTSIYVGIVRYLLCVCPHTGTYVRMPTYAVYMCLCLYMCPQVLVNMCHHAIFYVCVLILVHMCVCCL
jgi:hypothetical protein